MQVVDEVDNQGLIRVETDTETQKLHGKALIVKKECFEYT